MIRLARVTLLALGIAAGVGGFYLSALMLAAGSVALHRYDLED